MVFVVWYVCLVLVIYFEEAYLDGIVIGWILRFRLSNCSSFFLADYQTV